MLYITYNPIEQFIIPLLMILLLLFLEPMIFKIPVKYISQRLKSLDCSNAS